MALSFDTQTTIYDAPALSVPKPSGIVPPNTGPDIGNTGELVIPLVLTVFNPANRRPRTNIVTSVPIIMDNHSFGGSTVSQGPRDSAKITLEGHMDTPCIDLVAAQAGTDSNSSSFRVPELNVDGVRYTYGEYLAALIEGRFTTSWIKVEPNWFRDPYGRVYSDIKVFDYAASYVESVPGRTNFTMQLISSGGS